MKLFQTRNVAFQDGALRIRHADRQMDRKVGPGLPALRPGWRAISVVSLGGFLHCLRLSAGTQDAYWYLDEDLNLKFHQTEQLLSSFRLPGSDESLLDAAFEDLEAAGRIDEAMEDVVHLIREFSGAAAAVPKALPQILSDPESSPLAARAQAAMRELNRQDSDRPAWLEEIVSDAAFRRGFVEAEHPAGGRLRIDDFLPYANFWHIGFSADLADPYCTLITQHGKIAEALFDTRANVLYAKKTFVEQNKPAVFSNDHLVCIRLVRRYLYPALRKRRAETPAIGLMMRENHLGHYIWNELSSVDAILRSGRTPAIFSYPSSDEPIYPVDQIFPETRGKVRRGVCGLADLLAAVCQEGVAFFPFHAYRVTQPLADRILKLAFARERAFAETLTAEKAKATILLIGLRLENRCWRRQGAGYVELIRRLSEIPDRRFLLLFDGHNYKAGSKDSFMRSYGEHMTQAGAIPAIVRQEIELVESVMRQAEALGATNVKIRNLIPCAMGVSVVASKLCDYFITHWGAGLAKYKWIANAPGAVISSAEVLRSKEDLRIYDAEEFRENALALDYFPAEFVQSLGKEGHLVKTSADSRGDFDIDPGRFADFILSKLPAG